MSGKFKYVPVRAVLLFFLCVLLSAVDAFSQQRSAGFCGSPLNDLYILLKKEKFQLKCYNEPGLAIKNAAPGSGVFIVADGYPKQGKVIKAGDLLIAKRKRLRLYVEYPNSLAGLNISDTVTKTKLERGIITSGVFGEQLKPMSLLGINDCHFFKVKVQHPLIVIGKVAGFSKAEYGIDDIETNPLLFHHDGMLVAMTKLSNFATGRYEPQDSWMSVMEYVVSWVADMKDFHFNQRLAYVSPMYAENTPLPENARKISIEKGVKWFYNGRFFIDSSWKNMMLKYQGDGSNPFGPPVSQSLPNGDGSLGILEGHASTIYFDGTQQYRYWMRADVQGESAYALAAAGSYLHKEEYYKVAANLADYTFYNSNLRGGAKNDKDSSAYGLIGWAVTHPGVFYEDDNARFLLGMIGASAYMNTDKWNKEIAEAIMGNFRTTGKQGFRGICLDEKDIQKLGWKHFWDSDLVNPHPHLESWIWACYLWLYDKTGYEPLLTKTKNAIRMTMEAYPGNWKWTNGIEQERARMVLPLAWLVRVEDTQEHRQWLDRVVSDLLKNQDASGAIREELGDPSKGMYNKSLSNKEYGLHEAPLIFENGDPVADMLYTNNFAFFSLNEAAHATGDKKYIAALNKLADFLTRIQVKSEQHKDLDGAWFRAFDYKRWDYWASNADAGWGAWCTLTGWTQSWIVTTQVLVQQDQSYWELTKRSKINNQMPQTVKIMFGNEVK
ncbi:hypothetical protein [Pedobacter cryoconitis]|uniref:Uncharacterized protein n=1 Tax=Pedobacter cryoconitis TaxID=188932 RepID=A0A7X0MIR8_9SPHI|nr:hypothetical protein [Pedobacter cryoconitis]MBB6498845.1 hypothetical protein [Pedobacter cryoconitis]